MSAVKGIDVSSWQGKLDWSKIKAAGIDFAILRAGYGKNNIDTTFYYNAENASKAGVDVGAYWFSYAMTVDEAQAEADYLCAAVKSAGVPFTYPLCYDYEYDSYDKSVKNGVTPSNKLMVDMARAFLARVKENGYYPANYTNIDFLNRGFSALTDEYDLWLAQWSSTHTRECGLWQYSSTGKISGCSGYFDMDYAYKDYPAIIGKEATKMERLIVNTANCGVLDDWAEKQGIRYSYTITPQPGDLVLFDFKGTHKWRDHVGIVTGSSGNTVYTIEGNTSVTSNDNGGSVMRRTRYKAQITSFIRPKWTKEQTAKRLLEIAASQVGVKEIPSGSNNVKYNTWYYGREVSGSAYPWCCVFVEWCFAALAGQIDVDTTPQRNTLRSGSYGEDVKELQTKLNALGYNCGAVDGSFGTKTLAAVKAFQKDNGLVADGIVGPMTWDALDKAKPAETYPTLSKGSSGEYVKKLQEKLNALGYNCGAADGIFGAKTLAAVKAFQKAKGLVVDGVVGPATWGALK